MKEPYMLPDEDCERLKRTEMDAVRMLLAALSTAAYACRQGTGGCGWLSDRCGQWSTI